MTQNYTKTYIFSKLYIPTQFETNQNVTGNEKQNGNGSIMWRLNIIINALHMICYAKQTEV